MAGRRRRPCSDFLETGLRSKHIGLGHNERNAFGLGQGHGAEEVGMDSMTSPLGAAFSVRRHTVLTNYSCDRPPPIGPG